VSYSSEESKARREGFIAAGLCARCGQKPATHKLECEDCHAKHLNLERVRREKRKQVGLCVKCGRSNAATGKAMCEACRKKVKDALQRRRDGGKCLKCNRFVEPGSVHCKTCLANQRKYSAAVRHAAIMAYGGYRCACPGCTETTPEFLHIDHTNNDGAAHRRETKGTRGLGLYFWLKKNNYPSGFQVLCANCNHAKAIYGYCPHCPDREVNNAPVSRSRTHNGHAASTGIRPKPTPVS
jgi:hypothetical protein